MTSDNLNPDDKGSNLNRERPEYCMQEHLDYLSMMLKSIGTERPMWVDYLRERFPQLTREQAADIVFYCLETYVVAQPTSPPPKYFNY